ncbi:unnamed protein product [Meloidogyne enterolobii]|uniref:Uncharacterized protein n=1 Tax=Meloidogyne enterolobii TaxID=390850 RepID=A0ACB0XTB6_MELEN
MTTIATVCSGLGQPMGKCVRRQPFSYLFTEQILNASCSNLDRYELTNKVESSSQRKTLKVGGSVATI